jgi:uncharacterized surface protein with fasciclin (FAS1) repeats
MRLSLWSQALMASFCFAQGDLAALLKGQKELSTLLELVGLIPGLAATLSAASNITILAPTNEAFAKLPRDIPEGQAVELRNDTIAISALLANHVIKGVYPSNVITNIPTFAQTLLNSSYVSAIQPFSNFTGGAYNELVKDGDKVKIVSGEQTISTVTTAVSIPAHGILQGTNPTRRISNWAKASQSTLLTRYSTLALPSSSLQRGPVTTP